MSFDASVVIQPQAFRIRLRGSGDSLAGYWYLRLHGAGWLLTYRYTRRGRSQHAEGTDLSEASSALVRSLEDHVMVLFSEASNTAKDLESFPQEWERPGFRPGAAKRRRIQLTNHLAAFKRDWDLRLAELTPALIANGWPAPTYHFIMPWRRPVTPD